MPFKPELNYFFLYVQQFLRDKWDLEVERGDARILTVPLVEKIKAQILSADLVIADISGSNPNVLYEVGIAHAMGKPVLFLTQDAPEAAPVDIRHFEYIVYQLEKHSEFLAHLDNAMQNHVGVKHEALYLEAQRLLEEFNGFCGGGVRAVTRDEFTALVMRGARAGAIPSDPDNLAEFLLPKIIQDFTDVSRVRQYHLWVTTRSSGAA
jgi:hypothetical protein